MNKFLSEKDIESILKEVLDEKEPDVEHNLEVSNTQKFAKNSWTFAFLFNKAPCCLHFKDTDKEYNNSTALDMSIRQEGTLSAHVWYWKTCYRTGEKEMRFQMSNEGTFKTKIEKALDKIQDVKDNIQDITREDIDKIEFSYQVDDKDLKELDRLWTEEKRRRAEQTQRVFDHLQEIGISVKC